MWVYFIVVLCYKSTVKCFLMQLWADCNTNRSVSNAANLIWISNAALLYMIRTLEKKEAKYCCKWFHAFRSRFYHSNTKTSVLYILMVQWLITIEVFLTIFFHLWDYINCSLSCYWSAEEGNVSPYINTHSELYQLRFELAVDFHGWYILFLFQYFFSIN